MKKQLFFLLALVFIIFLAGCNLPAPVACAPGDLVAPALSSPAMWAVVDSLTPALSWDSTDSIVAYPYNTCFPVGYHVALRLDGPASLDIGGDNYGGHNRTWSPYSALAPASEYHWGVNAFGTTGPGPYAGDRVFFTGPICSTPSLVAPDLDTPGNGAIVATLLPTLDWNYPDSCIPQGYRIDLSTAASFSDTSLSGGTGNPSTRWSPGSPLTDCTLYYWRVAPINGTTLGPFSITRNFMVNTGSCLYPFPDLTIPIEPIVTIPPGLPELILTSNANCRIGPSLLYGVRTAYVVGTAVPINGRNADSSWLFTAKDNCYVSKLLGDFTGDLNLVPVLVDPPTPTEPPVPTKKPTRVPPTYDSCSDYPTQELCKQDPAGLGCTWSPNNVCLSKP